MTDQSGSISVEYAMATAFLLIISVGLVTLAKTGVFSEWLVTVRDEMFSAVAILCGSA